MDPNTLLDAFNHFLYSRRDYVYSLLICEILFSLPCKPRAFGRLSLRWILVPFAVAVYLTVGVHMPLITAGRLSIALSSLLIFFISILLQVAVLDVSGWRAIFNSTAAYTLQNLTLNVFEVASFLLGAEGWGKLLVKVAITVLVYTGCYHAFAKKYQHQELNLNKAVLVQLLLTTVFVSNFLFAFVSSEYADLPLLKIPLAFCCFLALEVQFGAFRGSSLNQEKEILEQLLYREQKQHQLMQETIDVINIKSHDLKKQIALLRQNLGDGSAELIREVENAVSSYDNLVNSGNKNLDLIISEEKLLCEKYRIPFDVMADGSAIGFIQPVDLYSLIGNALRNAVENSAKENEKHRSICLDIHAVNGYACIEITNYCTQEIRFANGLPVTSKGDAKFHGYGVKSMEYVVKKYGGNMVIQYQNNTFLVKVILPLPKEKQA